MERITYVPMDSDEMLSLDSEGEQPILTRRGPNDENWMIILVGLGFAVLAAIVCLFIFFGGFQDLAFGNTG